MINKRSRYALVAMLLSALLLGCSAEIDDYQQSTPQISIVRLLFRPTDGLGDDSGLSPQANATF